MSIRSTITLRAEFGLICRDWRNQSLGPGDDWLGGSEIGPDHAHILPPPPEFELGRRLGLGGELPRRRHETASQSLLKLKFRGRPSDSA